MLLKELFGLFTDGLHALAINYFLDRVILNYLWLQSMLQLKNKIKMYHIVLFDQTAQILLQLQQHSLIFFQPSLFLLDFPNFLINPFFFNLQFLLRPLDLKLNILQTVHQSILSLLSLFNVFPSFFTFLHKMLKSILLVLNVSNVIVLLLQRLLYRWT